MIENINRSSISESEFSGVKTYGNPESFHGPAIVGFVDLLGFSASVKANWNDLKNSPLERLLQIKKTAETSRDTTIAIAANKSAPPKVKQAFRSRIHTVSDSIVVCSALPPEVPVHEFSLHLSAVFFTTQILWECAVEEGYTIRGAVEWGQIYWTPADTIGPAFLDAYSLENKFASWSRVIIGPSLLRAIVQLPSPSSELVCGFLGVSPDGLIELPPSRLSPERHLQRLETMEAAAGSSRDKYRPLLSVLRGEKQVHRPTHADLERGILTLEDRIRRR